MKTALVIIDVQNDFLPGGALPVENGFEIIPIINRIIPHYNLVVATQDWHPHNHKSFASQHKGKNVMDIISLNGTEQVLWPNHCVQGTKGAELVKELHQNPIETIFRKGTNPEMDSYSGFYDNNHLKSTGLTGYLKDKEVGELHFCGLAEDFCVYYSIKDALKEGFKVKLIKDATKPINQERSNEQIKELLNNNNFALI